MATLPVEQPPYELDSDLTAYLVRQWNKIDLALGEDNYWEPRNTLPAKIRVGESYYFAIPILPDITSEGLWLVKSTGWAFVA